MSPVFLQLGVNDLKKKLNTPHSREILELLEKEKVGITGIMDRLNLEKSKVYSGILTCKRVFNKFGTPEAELYLEQLLYNNFYTKKYKEIECKQKRPGQLMFVAREALIQSRSKP